MKSTRLFQHAMFFRYQRSLFTAAMKPIRLVFADTPLPKEKKEQFQQRILSKITQTLHAPNQLVFMSYPTRIAETEETLANAARRLGTKNMAALGLSFTENPFHPGHCMTTLLDNKSRAMPEHTISLRPDMQAQPIYSSMTAFDERLPKMLLDSHTHVRPAVHTTLLEEIKKWLDAAFYIYHVHHNRPIYPLTCFLSPIAAVEKQRYLAAVAQLKQFHQRYSLLDHLHPHTDGHIVKGQNCTVVYKLFEALRAGKIDCQALLGDNPTPQLVTAVVEKLYFQFEKAEIRQTSELIELTDDELQLVASSYIFPLSQK